MTIKYTWVISLLDCHTDKDNRHNVVFNIHWRRQAVDGLYLADLYGTTALDYDPYNLFITYADITQAHIETWLESALGSKRITELDRELDRQLAEQHAPSVTQPPLPWIK